MNAWLERTLVGLIVAAGTLYALKALVPFAWRVALARALAGRVPDRLRIWLAGSRACGACGSPGPAAARRR